MNESVGFSIFRWLAKRSLFQIRRGGCFTLSKFTNDNNNNNNNNNNNFIYTAKIGHVNLNIKTAGINLCAVDKIFQISVRNEKFL